VFHCSLQTEFLDFWELIFVGLIWYVNIRIFRINENRKRYVFDSKFEFQKESFGSFAMMRLFLYISRSVNCPEITR
jgi:hypothetical protein